MQSKQQSKQQSNQQSQQQSKQQSQQQQIEKHNINEILDRETIAQEIRHILWKFR